MKSSVASPFVFSKVVFGADHAGLDLKTIIFDWLSSLGVDVDDLGTRSHDSVDYPDFAHRVAAEVKRDERCAGILVCGTGLGMAMSANRHIGVRAAVCTEPVSASLSRSHNDANVLCLGARLLGQGMALAMVEAFLRTSFEGGRHEGRICKIDQC